MSDAGLTLEDARRVLELGPGDGLEQLAGAFRAAVKLVHPDRPGGDARRFREVLDAYRMLQAQARSAPELARASASDIWITVQVPAWLLDRGGRAEVETPTGRKTLWISRRLAPQGVIRLPGQTPDGCGDLCLR